MNPNKTIAALLSRAAAGGDKLWGIDSRTGRGGWTTGGGWFKSDGTPIPDPRFDLFCVEGDKTWTRVPRGAD